MSQLGDFGKRILVGRALSSEQLHETLLPKRIALPVFASDALSSNAYATQEILLTLAVGGAALYRYAPWVAGLVVLVFFVVVASYRQNVHAYPSGGGDYEVVGTNLGAKAGVFVASALLVDYILTVAVSISSAVANIRSALPGLIGEHQVFWAVGLIVLIVVMNLRGVRESGSAFAIPVYGFILSIYGMVAYALWRIAHGDALTAESANWTIVAEGTFTGLALAYLVARAFSSGTTALTGIEAISNGVPAFQKPKSKNAATTLLLLGIIATSMFSLITWLAIYTGVKYTEFNKDLLLPDGTQAYTDPQQQKTVMVQIAQAVFGDFHLGTFVVTATTALILALAANTAFNGFPVLGSILARDGYLPRQLHTRGDRLAFSNGILVLAGLAIFLVVIYKADVTSLIQLYIVGVFVSFTLSQFGMIRHWTRLLKDTTDPKDRGRMVRSRMVNAVGFVMTGSVLVIVLATKFTRGAWIVCIAMPLLYLLMQSIRKHYDHVKIELAADQSESVTLPSRVHAIVLVSKVHKPTLRALAFARATRPSSLEALTVDVEEAETAALAEEWERRCIPVPLKVLDSPYREVTRPIVDYVKGLRRASPRDLVIVYVPEYVVGRWWEQVLHNQSALRLKTRLLFLPGVMVCAVPWQLASSELVADRPDPVAVGAVRRGEPDAAVQDAVVAAEYASTDDEKP
ncbi:MAG TPA: APC family permease [Candidatus Nanopelagicales bacterium]|nr:APC family permease [Candidatus Nanopelagicales bacterium]